MTLQTLQTVTGRVRYLQADVTNERDVDAALGEVAKEFSRLDLVIHGAGIQSSKLLESKRLSEFRSILATKLGGLGQLVRACERHFPARKIHFHLVTSTFSHLGNAGQEDYGAANLALDRVAQQLAALGATVVVNSFHSRRRGDETTAGIIAAGGKAVHLWGSAANPGHLRRIFAEIEQRFRGLDFFVSNATTGAIGLLKDIRPEHMEKAFRTNVMGLHQGAMLAADLMRRRGGGKVVALSSIGAHWCFDYFGCNGPIKAAVESLVRYLAVELGPGNIEVNAVSAGVIYGEWLDKYPDRPQWERLVPRGQLNSEEEVAAAVTFLLSSGGMNGASVIVDAAGRVCICEPAQ
jgi:NAD(P)-dependent dehydrogenase (short-subunit alcohol dehydrogenase family)